MMRLVLVAALLAGCSKQKADPGPTCDQVVDHMLEVTKQMLPGHGDQALGDRKAMIAQCEQRDMPAAQRKCLIAAKTLDELAACRSNETRPAPPQPPAAPDEPGGGAPAGSGS